MKGKPLDNPIRDENPCRDCRKPVRHDGCHDTCERRKTWLEEVERVKENRRKYEQRLGVRLKRK